MRREGGGELPANNSIKCNTRLVREAPSGWVRLSPARSGEADGRFIRLVTNGAEGADRTTYTSASRYWLLGSADFIETHPISMKPSGPILQVSSNVSRY